MLINGWDKGIITILIGHLTVMNTEYFKKYKYRFYCKVRAQSLRMNQKYFIGKYLFDQLFILLANRLAK